MLLPLSHEGWTSLLDEGVLLDIPSRLLELRVDVLIEIFPAVAVAVALHAGGFRVGQFGVGAVLIWELILGLPEGETVLPAECLGVTHFGGEFIFEVDVILGILRK